MDGTDPIENLKIIESELANYSEALCERPIVIAFNKTDLIDEQTLTRLQDEIKPRSSFAISSVTGAGVDQLMAKLDRQLTEHKEKVATDPEFEEAENALRDRISADVLAKSEELQQRKADRRAQQNKRKPDDDVEVVYVEQ
jgi:GTP-binding protein